MISRQLVLRLAGNCGVGVRYKYFCQAVTTVVEKPLHLTCNTAVWSFTGTQIGYTAHIVIVGPQRKEFTHGSFVVVLLGITARPLQAASTASAREPVVALSTVVGLTTMVSQVVGVLVIGLLDPDRLGPVIRSLVSGTMDRRRQACKFGPMLIKSMGSRTKYLLDASVNMLVRTVIA
ncbi:hypothetical protein [Streptomyces rimosus]|uniref:hypothetical protein n=1 Tax=Streptomyces rimosus TaxID=1927 RepID=UPI00311D6E7F